MTIKNSDAATGSGGPTRSYSRPLWTVDELVVRTKLKKRWVYNNIHLVPHVKIAGQLRFRPEVIEAWLDEHSRGAAA